ncbi:hypothetical protein BKA65DRAFT_41432 [Rhexocercosporidium sp. MPI-PUGE-AT-0058]|nr:hypothetical protein BKA65DRAFT_41432 [Rhexocercosporidium sp. MPI-PUGE-AT-0058]
MDWPSLHDPFLLPNCKDAFACDPSFKAKNKLHCTVLQVYDTDGRKRVEKSVLKTEERWDNWFTKCGIFSEEDAPIPPSKLPTSGACIFFIPRTEDVELPENDPIEADLTDLPIHKKKWEKIAKAFHLLPSHIVKAIAGKKTFVTSISRNIHDDDGIGGPVWPLWMQIATTSTQGPDTFAFASTHIDRAHLTLAVMIGCSVKQINRVRNLLEGAELAIQHPLLMLGICAELQLDRLKKLVEDKVTECLETTRLLEATRQGGITWVLINKVRACRDGSKRAEEEVNATKRQLAKALPSDFASSVERTENHESNDGNSNKKRRGSIHSDINAPSASTSKPELDKEDELPTNFTAMFSERFADIFAQFDGLVAECRISVEEMSFAADIIRSELARQEAKMSTVIAFVAMLYLPMTTIATIFAMPVFQFPNDWKNWRYQSVHTGGSSRSNSTTNNSPDLPVLSGYFWIYAGISIAFTLFTIEGWWRFTSREIERRRGVHWSRYLWRKAYTHIK